MGAVDAVTGQTAAKTRTFAVVEVFGPTIQGEGALAGLSTYFVRFGGCDYRCLWCDSLYAVIPSQVRENSVKMTADEIAERIVDLPRGAKWVTFSGGNPALLELGELTKTLQYEGGHVAVETQGSRWRDWLADVDCLTVSPKPPSSGMAERADRQIAAFMSKASEEGKHHGGALKIVVFDETDFEWAAGVIHEFPRWPAFLSCGTDPPEAGESYETSVMRIANRYRWLCERVAATESLSQVRVLPQLHVLSWGHQRGV